MFFFVLAFFLCFFVFLTELPTLLIMSLVRTRLELDIWVKIATGIRNQWVWMLYNWFKATAGGTDSCIRIALLDYKKAFEYHCSVPMAREVISIQNSGGWWPQHNVNNNVMVVTSLTLRMIMWGVFNPPFGTGSNEYAK